MNSSERMASHCLACRAGMIPLNAVLAQTAFSPIAFAMASPSSTSAPTGFCAVSRNSSGGELRSEQYLIWPPCSSAPAGTGTLLDAADAPVEEEAGASEELPHPARE